MSSHSPKSMPNAMPEPIVCTQCQARCSPALIALNGLCAICQRQRREAIESAMRMRREAGIPARFAYLKAWDDLRTRLAVDQAGFDGAVESLRAFLNDGTASVLIMIGARGSGKTSMACVAIQQAIERGRAARYVATGDVLRDLKARFGDDGGEAAWMRQWSAPWLLVLDEFAERSESDWACAELTGLIDARHRELRKTILIANFTREAFAELAGGSVMDRAREGAGGVILCDWPTFRGRPGAIAPPPAHNPSPRERTEPSRQLPRDLAGLTDAELAELCAQAVAECTIPFLAKCWADNIREHGPRKAASGRTLGATVLALWSGS